MMKDHDGRVVGWVRYDGDEYHDFRYQTEDPSPMTVATMTREGYLPLFVGVQDIADLWEKLQAIRMAAVDAQQPQIHSLAGKAMDILRPWKPAAR